MSFFELQPLKLKVNTKATVIALVVTLRYRKKTVSASQQKIRFSITILLELLFSDARVGPVFLVAFSGPTKANAYTCMPIRPQSRS